MDPCGQDYNPEQKVCDIMNTSTVPPPPLPPPPPLLKGEDDSSDVDTYMLLCALVVVYALCVILIYYEKLPAIFEDCPEEENFLRICGDARVLVIKNFEDASRVRTNDNCQFRRIPPLLAEPNRLNLYQEFPKGMCYSRGEASRALRSLMDSVLHSPRSILTLNTIVAKIARSTRSKAKKQKIPTKFSLKNIEIWILQVTMEVLFQVTLTGDPLAEMYQALHQLNEVKEEIGKMVYTFNFLRTLLRGVRSKELLVKYYASMTVIYTYIKSRGGIGHFIDLAKDKKIDLQHIFGSEQNTHNEIYEMIIETLTMSMKKLGYYVFECFKHFATCKVLQLELLPCLKDAQEAGEDISVSQQQEMAPLLALVMETLRYSADTPRYCHQRTNSCPIQIGDYEYPADMVILPKRNLSEDMEQRWKHLEAFSPQVWFHEQDMGNDFDDTVASDFHAFGAGERKCIAEKFSLTMMMAFITHFTVKKKSARKRLWNQDTTTNTGNWWAVPGSSGLYTTVGYSEATTAQLSEDTTAQLSEDTTAQLSEDTTALLSEDTTAQLSEDTTAQLSEDTTAQLSEDTTALLSEDTTALLSEDTTALLSEDTTAQDSSDSDFSIQGEFDIDADIREDPLFASFYTESPPSEREVENVTIAESIEGLKNGTFVVHRAFCPSAGEWIGGVKAVNKNDYDDKPCTRVFLEKSEEDDQLLIVIYERVRKIDKMEKHGPTVLP